MIVAAPGLIPRPVQDRVKTDRRDARLLARLLCAGQLVGVAVPSPELEAFRDLVRAREDERRDLTAVRHRIVKLLLRYDVRSPYATNWTKQHR